MVESGAGHIKQHREGAREEGDAALMAFVHVCK